MRVFLVVGSLMPTKKGPNKNTPIQPLSPQKRGQTKTPPSSPIEACKKKGPDENTPIQPHPPLGSSTPSPLLLPQCPLPPGSGAPPKSRRAESPSEGYCRTWDPKILRSRNVRMKTRVIGGQAVKLVGIRSPASPLGTKKRNHQPTTKQGESFKGEVSCGPHLDRETKGPKTYVSTLVVRFLSFGAAG